MELRWTRAVAVGIHGRGLQRVRSEVAGRSEATRESNVGCFYVRWRGATGVQSRVDRIPEQSGVEVVHLSDQTSVLKLPAKHPVQLPQVEDLAQLGAVDPIEDLT